MTRILLDCRWLTKSPRGIGVFTKNLVNALILNNDIKLEIYLVVRREYVASLLIELPKNFQIIQIPDWCPDPILDFFVFSFLAKKISADVVHFTGNTGCVLIGVKVRVLLTIHDVSYLKSSVIVPFPRKNLKQALGRFYRKIFVPFYAKRASEICTVSDFAVQDIQFELGVKADFIYHGSANTQKRNITDKCLEKTLYDKSDKLAYVVISGLDPQKNLSFVVSAFIDLYWKYKKNSPILKVIGVTLSGFEKLQPNTLLTENILFLGVCSNHDVQAHIFRSKTIIIPSFYESFGLPVVEALSYLKAPLCSCEGALSEIGGTFAHYFDPRNQASLLNLIDAVETGKLSIMLPAKTVKQYLKKFSWSKVAVFYKNKYGINTVS